MFVPRYHSAPRTNRRGGIYISDSNHTSAGASLHRVVLTGFMGSGKTTVGRLLAARLGWVFVDLDDEIGARCAATVPEIFFRFGEAHFRREESLALAACIARPNIVLALGGGVPETEANHALLRAAPQTAVVYLQGPFDALHARCLKQSTGPKAVVRPVLADSEAARLRFTRRTPLYEAIATLTVDALGTPQTIADDLAALLGFQTPG